MDDNKPVKRGRGRPRIYTEDNPKPRIDESNPLEVIRKPKRTDLANTADLPEGDNNKYTTFALAIMQLPKIDVRNPEQLRARVVEYFSMCAEYDMKPGVAAVGLALGINRRRLWEIRSGTRRTLAIPKECEDIINDVYDSLELLWENYMQNGKINPVSGIFLGKNNFGYQDRQDYVVTPNTGLSQADPATIEAKYAELPDVDGEDK